MNKSELYAACIAKQQSKLEELQNAIDKVQESIVGEQNSTAGNKFETARAMAQEELDRLNQTQEVAVREMNILSQIDAEKECTSAQLGAFITTDKRQIYMAVGIGRLPMDGTDVFVISSASPIGRVLMGKEKGDSIEFGGKKEKITSIS